MWSFGHRVTSLYFTGGEGGALEGDSHLYLYLVYHRQGREPDMLMRATGEHRIQ